MASIGIMQLQEALNDCDTAMQIIDEVVYGDGKLNDGEYVDLCNFIKKTRNLFDIYKSNVCVYNNSYHYYNETPHLKYFVIVLFVQFVLTVCALTKSFV